MAEKDVVSINSKEAQDFLRQRQQGTFQPDVQGGVASQSNVVPLTSPQAQSMLQRNQPAVQQNFTLGEAASSGLQAFPRDLMRVYGDTLSALASPIDLVKGAFQLGGGAAISALPQGGQDWLKSVASDPVKMQQSIDMAKAAGGDLARKYGTAEGFKRTLATTPAEMLADFSVLFSGGATATARAAPTVSRALDVGANLTNPFVPLAVAAETRVPLTNKTPLQMASGAGNLISEFATGTRGQGVARNIIRESLGDRNNAIIQQLSDPRFANMSAAEAVLAAGVDRPQFQALGRDVAQPDPQNLFFQREQAAAQGRQDLIRSVTPDEELARQARASATDPMFKAARNFNLPVDTTGIIKNINDTLKANPGNKTLRAALLDVKKGVRKSKTAGELSSVVDGIKTQLASRDNKFVQGKLIDVRDQIIGLIPGLGEARQTFAQMSAPVNQAQVLREMSQRLTGPLDAERPGQFMRVLGEGEGALFKRSTGAPRFEEGDLMRLLTQEQGSAATEVSDQLRRQAEMSRQASRGEVGLRQILNENAPIGFRLPNVLNREIMIANRTLNLLEGKISDGTRKALEQAMFSGEDLNRFMSTVPATERTAIRGAFDQVFNIDTMRNVGLIERMTEEEEIPRIELRNMAR
jgi:hypothetical protein